MIPSDCELYWFAIWVQEKEGVLEEKEGNAQKGTLSLSLIHI